MICSENCPIENFYPIIVSSHAEYAIEAIREEAFDYLVKPLDEKELRQSLDRFRASINSEVLKESATNENTRVFEAKDQSTTIFINENDISYLEADGSYTKIVYNKKEFVMSKNLKHIYATLSQDTFFRCSSKYVVNLSHIDYINNLDRQAILKDGSKIQFSFRRKEEFLKRLKNGQ